jgi:MGT family glycosyltransferase
MTIDRCNDSLWYYLPCGNWPSQPHARFGKYSPTWWPRLRNRVGYSLLNRLTQPMRDVVSTYRQEWNLPAHYSRNDSYSKLAQLSQQPAEFDFPRRELPQYFHYIGPYQDSTSRQSVSFPWEKLTGQPLIYASMGTVQNRLIGVFEQFASACAGLDAQLVISLGGSANPEDLPALPGNPLLVGYAPQLELLPKAALTITHAGLNTALESLANGVPMVAIPITNDRPGVAARIAWTGTGEVVPLKNLDTKKLRSAIEKVLSQNSYKRNAIGLQEAIGRAGGMTKAADIIDRVIQTGKPVLF